MADKVYCEKCRFLFSIYINVDEYQCKHKNNVKLSDSWLRKHPSGSRLYKWHPSEKNMHNDCSDFEPKQ